MALDIGTLVANLEVNGAGASSGLAKAETQLTSQAKGTGSKMGTALGGGITSALKAGLGIAAGFAAFKGVTDFIKGSVSAGEELNSTLERSNVVFDKSATSVQAWAGTTDKSLGLSEQAALEYASQLGNVYDQLGFASDASASMAEETTTLAVQIGAFKKQDPSDVIAKITAGFRGQYRGLAQLVPGITAAKVAQEAMSETGKKNANTLTAQEKATATLALVQKGSGNAQKFYADTAGEMGRQQAIFDAELDNMKAKLGQDAIPLLTTLARIAADDVIPAVETAGQDLEQLAKDINGLPSPVKAAGASLLALVLLGPEIRELADSVGNNLGDALETARIQALYMKDDFAKAGGGVKGLAVAIGSGASAGLRGAASGLLDVIGGPWGAAFLGASAAVGVLISKHAAAQQQISTYTAAIKADSGALAENTRAAVVNALSKTDAFNQARQLGINLEDLTDDLLGNADAQGRVNAALDAYKPSAAVRSGDSLQSTAAKLSETLGSNSSALGKAATAANQYGQAMGPTAAATDGASTAQDGLGTSTDTTTGAITKQTAAVKTQVETFDDAITHALGLRSANRDYQQSLDDATKSLKENGKTLDSHTQKGRDNAAALDAVVSAIQGQIDAESRSGTITDTARAKLNKERDALITLATKFYGSRDAAKAYVDKLLQIPKTVNTKVNLTFKQQGSSLQQAINSYLGKTGIPGLPSHNPPSANGNIFYAQGGENHVAQIGSGNTRTWDEPETGGEAYIPLALSKRTRSAAILSKVAQQFGMTGGMGIGEVIHIDNFNAQGQSPDAVAARLAFQLTAAG